MRGLSQAQILALPAVVDVVTAGRALGIGRTKAYQLARTGAFPCRVLRVGSSYAVALADLLALLGLTDQTPAISGQQPTPHQHQHQDEDLRTRRGGGGKRVTAAEADGSFSGS